MGRPRCLGESKSKNKSKNEQQQMPMRGSFPLQGQDDGEKRATPTATGWLEGFVVEGGGVGAGEAEALACVVDEAVEVDAFAAAGAGYALAFEAGEFAGWERDADPLGGEEVGVGELAIGLHLLRVFFQAGVELAGAGFGGFKGYDAEGFVVVGIVGVAG
jgi:hypothetical protein